MEFNQENIESVVKELTTSGLVKAQNDLFKMTEEVRKIVENVMKENPNASHDEVIQLAIETFEKEMEGQQIANNVQEQDQEEK